MQDRKTYAEGVTNVMADAKAKIGMPVVDGEYTVASESTLASFAGEIPESGSMLVTLEVNGTVIAYREMYTIDPDEGYIHVGDYSIANDSGSVTIETMEGGDVVRLKVEPVVLEMNDVFRAAVGEVAPKSEGGGSGGGVLVVHETVSGGTHTLDKTWQEIHDAVFSVLVSTTGESNKSWGVIASCDYISDAGKYVVMYSTVDGPSIFDCDSASGYPSYEEEDGH